VAKIKAPITDADLAALGLETSGDEGGGLRLIERQNLRSDKIGLRRRGGHRLVARAVNENGCYDLDGSTQYATILRDTRVHTLKRQWTFEALVHADSFATNEKTIYGVAHAADYSLLVYFTTAGVLTAKIQDSAGTVVTLTSSALSIATSYGIQVVRDGTSLLLRIDGTTADSDTMADLDCKAPGGSLYIGRNNTTNAFDGRIQYVRGFSTARADMSFSRLLLPQPRADDVLFDYVMEAVATGGTAYVEDRSRFENHGTLTGAPVEIASICNQTAPVSGIASWVDENAKHMLQVLAGREAYLQAMSL
jgi:hypothetical protein